ncbi:hypothetical protein G7Z17_g4536 [Cylindrodendrum hubeiense]|uniref:Uncharacterized protein n=1 Tax=Cylindrodendrum hubeiense TaxID=595255 RepID=A0A9P5HAK9_9HYPO|nr:hypothetical protein G7Z17_g4536 [Cylindrodendrum hubeiense]
MAAASATTPKVENQEETIIEQWHELVEAIKATTGERLLDRKSFSSMIAFRSYWYGIFTCLEESILSNQNIPEFLTSPPVPKITITVTESQEWIHCPCCWIDDRESEISLQNDNGVTKSDFMQAFKDHLYGEIPPETDDDDSDPPSHWSFMYALYRPKNEREPGRGQKELKISMDCCEAGEFKKRVKQREEAELAAQKT